MASFRAQPIVKWGSYHRIPCLITVAEYSQLLFTTYQDQLSQSGVGWSCSSSPKFARAQNWPFCFWDENLCIVFDASSPLSSTRIDKIKQLSIMCICIIFLVLIIPWANISCLKVEVIHAPRWCRSMLSGISESWSPNSSRPLMKITVILPGNHLQHLVICMQQ
jgi:hypothetical protein